MRLICIECPRGCELDVRLENGVVAEVSGNLCVKGKRYAEDECVMPKRVITTTVKLDDNTLLPVKTTPVNKNEQLEIMERINAIIVSPPVRIGQVIAENIDGKGATLIASAERRTIR